MKYVNVQDILFSGLPLPDKTFWITSGQTGVAAGLTPGLFTHTITAPGSETSIFINKIIAFAEFNDGTDDFSANWFSLVLPAPVNQVSLLQGVLDVPQTVNVLYQGKVIELQNYEIRLDATRQFFMDVFLMANSFGAGVACAPGDAVVTQVCLLVSE